VYAETERAGLCEFLDMQREALIEKLQGVSNEEARRTPTVSSLSLLSLVKHSAIWERRWFQIVVVGRSFAGEWPEVQPNDENGFRINEDDTIEPSSRTTGNKSLLRKRSSEPSISTRRA
jgi:Protein of unknown function (DUF664)